MLKLERNLPAGIERRLANVVPACQTGSTTVSRSSGMRRAVNAPQVFCATGCAAAHLLSS